METVVSPQNDNRIFGQLESVKCIEYFSDLGIKPTALEAVLPEYLWSFRDSGQYSDIKQSARNLR